MAFCLAKLQREVWNQADPENTPEVVVIYEEAPATPATHVATKERKQVEAKAALVPHTIIKAELNDFGGLDTKKYHAIAETVKEDAKRQDCSDPA